MNKSTTPAKKPYRKRHLFPRTLATITENITAPMLDGKQRMLRMLMKDWPAIIGDELAHDCSPAKLHFPRGETTGGVLHLHVSAHKAPEIPYMAPQMLESLARYIGFRAIERIVVDPERKD